MISRAPPLRRRPFRHQPCLFVSFEIYFHILPSLVIFRTPRTHRRSFLHHTYTPLAYINPFRAQTLKFKVTKVAHTQVACCAKTFSHIDDVGILFLYKARCCLRGDRQLEFFDFDPDRQYAFRGTVLECVFVIARIQQCGRSYVYHKAHRRRFGTCNMAQMVHSMGQAIWAPILYM